tara:strand:- start:996 stop:3779 length:2784 start_codon:yes stop_codon:yes gene_type:complete
MTGRKFHTFLKSKCAGKGVPLTNTRIGDKDKNIYGGSYQINNYEEFIEKYYEHVFLENNLEYLTETQLIENGPLLIDIDLCYQKGTKTKQHSHEHVIDLVMAYLVSCSKFLEIPKKTTIDVYIMEKKKVNCLDNKTKDGIHIIIGLSVHKAVQILIRNQILEQIKTLWSDLPIINTWEDVIDEGVAKGHVNWQLYGSRKPNHGCYLVNKHIVFTYDTDEDDESEWILEDKTNVFNLKKELHKLSARYEKYPKFDYLPERLQDINQAIDNFSKKPKAKFKIKQSNDNNTNVWDIRDNETLDKMLDELFENLSVNDYKLKETHMYTMILPCSYYGPGSFSKWIRVGWALANVDKRLFLTWLKFSSQTKCRETLADSNGVFDWNNVPELYNEWKTFDNKNPDSLSERSIMYWAKTEGPAEEYEKIRKENISYFIEQTLITKSATEFDLANVLFNMYKHNYACVSIKNNQWYEYRNNRWHGPGPETNLRLNISVSMHQIYLDNTLESMALLQSLDQSDPKYEPCRKRVEKLTTIAQSLKTTTLKNNLMREAKDLYYDPLFLKNLDQNPYLLCFNNGVIDFNERIFRDGQPLDYISKSTNINYIVLTKKHDSIISEINNFIKQLFPDKELCDYMWQHLASILIGTNSNQTFNIYTGSGRNGKSKLVDLISKSLGDYKGTVPITLITQNRNSIGSTSSEIVQLKGTRYAVMQEPSKGDKINEGIMKEITGGDPIQGRALFQEPITFIPQFKLVVCTNTLFDIKSNDDGTWRRIRVCDFKSKFLENPYEDEIKFPREHYPFQYLIDKNIESKFDDWAEVFMSMLVNKAFENNGNVKDCNMVLASSDTYREGQDYLTEFIKENIIKKMDQCIKKTDCFRVFKEWYIANYGRHHPKGREVYEFMDLKFGKYRQGWHNVCLIEDADIDITNDDEVIY